MSPLENALYSKEMVSYVGSHQAAASYAASTEVTIANASSAEAGLAVFQSASYHYFLGLRGEQGRYEAFVEQVIDGKVTTVARQSLTTPVGEPVKVKVHGEGALIEFAIEQNGEWLAVGEPQDATWLSTQKAGGFVGTTIGPHARK